MKLVLVFLMSFALFNCTEAESPSGNDNESSATGESSSQAASDACVETTSEVLLKQASVVAEIGGGCKVSADCDGDAVCAIPGEGCLDTEDVPDADDCGEGFYCQGDDCVQYGECVEKDDSCLD